MDLHAPRTLGRSGVAASRLGLGSSYGVGEKDVERAIERGVSFLYWGTRRRDPFGRAIARAAARRREGLTIVIQSYTRVASLLATSVEHALKRLSLEYADFVLLGLWNHAPPARIVDAAGALVASGKARHVMISSHQRTLFPVLAADPRYGALMVRYNAAHPGAEEEVFPKLPEARPGIVAYTATRWGGLLDRRLVPPGEPVPRGSDCYRFALSHPSVDVVLAGPRDGAELDEALAALDRGPMTPDELAWMKRVGVAVRGAQTLQKRADAPVTVFDRVLKRVQKWF